jgi:ABC-type branched-subunit amino acid transport system substrate-binding protein
MISPGCTNPKVTDRSLKSVNRVCARDDLQGPASIQFAVDELKVKKVAVFDDGTTGPRGGADEVEKKGKELGVEVLRYVIRSGDKDFRAILGTVPRDIDLIVASLWAPDAALIAKQLPDFGLDVRMIGPDGQYEPVDYIEASAGAAEGNYVTFLVPDLKKVPAATAFSEAFEAEYGPVSSYGPLAYEATNIILSAIEKVGKLDRAAVRDAVRATENYTGNSRFSDHLRRQGRSARGPGLHLPGPGDGVRAGGLRQPEVEPSPTAWAAPWACSRGLQAVSKRFGGLRALCDIGTRAAETCGHLRDPANPVAGGVGRS